MTPATVRVQTPRAVVPVAVRVATTPADCQQGYRGRPAPAHDGEGILFLFPFDALHAFHMVGVPFDLDILMGRADGTVTGVTTMKAHNAGRYCPALPTRFALELRAGWASRHGMPLRVVMP